MRYLVLFRAGGPDGQVATQVVDVSRGIRDEADVAYVADVVAGELDDGRPVQVLAWSPFAAAGERG